MAILVWYKKIREDSREVEYSFGYPELDRRLVIETASAQGRPLDGNEDQRYLAVLWKIQRSRTSEGRWPEKGTYAA
jgi:hypothetical protein